MRISLFVALLAFSAPAAMAVENSPRPGGIALIDAGPASAAAPVVQLRDRRVLVMRSGDRWVAAVGIPLDADVGPLSIRKPGERSVNVDIEDYPYRVQRLTVSNQSFVTPDQAQLDRIARERVIIDNALNNWREQDLDSISLAPPVEGPRSSSFGLRRFFNDQPRSPHKGMDIAAPTGESILAPKAGIVTATGDFFFNGNTVILDHGQGFVTMYCHLSRIDVEYGQEISAGTKLGEVGATGRVTGPHLHFGTYLNGTAVDPAIVLPD